MVYILALFGLFWLLFKKLGDFFSKSSGHPGPHLIRLTDLDELFKASGDSKIVRAPGYWSYDERGGIFSIKKFKKNSFYWVLSSI